MQLGGITAQRLVAALGAEARTLVLEPGSELSARVVAGPNAGGTGVISLAGLRLEARMPATLQAGDEVRLVVVRAGEGELVAKIARPEDAAAGARADLAGRLAVSGDGDMLRGALALAEGGPLWLPEGRAAEVAVDADGGEGPGSAGGARASFVLHCPRAGAIEVHLSMDAGSVRAGVVAPPALAGAADASLAELVSALGAAAGRPATAAVRTRPEAQPPPRPPAGRIDERA